VLVVELTTHQKLDLEGHLSDQHADEPIPKAASVSISARNPTWWWCTQTYSFMKLASRTRMIR
jgi:hypothetical protein